MIKSILWVLFYLGSAVLILRIHHLAPTDLAGPGLDLPIYILAVVGGCILLAKNIVRSSKTKKVTRNALINMLGALIMVLVTLYAFGKW